MKILLTNHQLNAWGGSESYIFTLCRILFSQGHTVHVFTLNSGVVSNFLFGMADIRTTERPPDKEYDLCLVNHNTCLHYLLVTNVQGRKIFVSHGFAPRVERPIPGADAYACISQELKEKWETESYFKFTVINNPIDLSYYYPERKLRKKPKTILCLCQGITARTKIQRMSDSFEIIMTPQERDDRLHLLRDTVNQADVVISLGRGVYESLACGRPALVYDSRSYMGECGDGLITKETLPRYLKHNCSGRALHRPFDQIINEILSEYKPKTEYYRALAEKYFDGRKIVNKLISL